VVGHVPVPVSEGIERCAQGRALPPVGIATFRVNLRAICIVKAQWSRFERWSALTTALAWE